MDKELRRDRGKEKGSKQKKEWILLSEANYFWLHNKPPTVRLFNSVQSPGLPSKLISLSPSIVSLPLSSYPSPSTLFQRLLGAAASISFFLAGLGS